MPAGGCSRCRLGFLLLFLLDVTWVSPFSVGASWGCTEVDRVQEVSSIALLLEGYKLVGDCTSAFLLLVSSTAIEVGSGTAVAVFSLV